MGCDSVAPFFSDVMSKGELGIKQLGLRETLNKVIDVQERAPVVDFPTFLTHRNYLGLSGIYPFWLKELKGFDDSISRLLITGSLGSGKSSLINAALLYRIYLLFEENGGDVCKTLGLMSGSPIYCLYFSVSLSAAKKSGFQQIKSWVDNSKWFSENFPRDKKVESSIRFGNGFSIDFASGSQHQVGLNTWGFVLDEANFRDGVGTGVQSEYSEVTDLAQQLEDRQLNRFSRGGKLQSFAGYVSSASYASAFIEDKMLELRDDKSAKIITAVRYKITPEQFSREKFEVFVGHDQLSPAIVQNKEHRKQLLESTGLSPALARGLFEKVPVDLKSQFKKNIYLAIQNHCGRSTAMKGTFITNYEIVKDRYAYDRRSPLRVDSIVLSNGDDVRISDFVSWGSFEFPDRPHSLYLDLSLSGDAGSLSCFRFDGVNPGSGQRLHEHVFTLVVQPPAYPSVTKISKIKDFVLEFAEHLNLAVFGSDNFQSENIRQDVSDELGLQNVRVSLDSTDLPHLLWVAALVDCRVSMLYYERLDREIREAVHDVKKHKVVKAEGSSDDQFQSMVGAFFLSDTIGAALGDIDGLLGARLNLVGSTSMGKMMSALGYSQSIPLSGGFVRSESESVSRRVLPSASSGVPDPEEVVESAMDILASRLREKKEALSVSLPKTPMDRLRERSGAWWNSEDDPFSCK